MCSSLSMRDMLHTLTPYFTSGLHYHRSSVRWSSQDGSSTSHGNAVLSPDCTWCSKDGAADRKTSGTTQGWGLFSRWHHHHWCPRNRMWRREVSYTDKKSKDYVGGSNKNFTKVYHKIYAESLGAKFWNMLIICCMWCDSCTFTDILKHIMWCYRKFVSGSLLRNFRSWYKIMLQSVILFTEML